MSLAWSGYAQSQPPDLDLFVNFIAISNSPPPPQGLSGQALYDRILPGMSTYTNLLEVHVGFPTTPKDGWILEMEADGSFTPVTELSDPYNFGYFYKWVTLTTNQIHSMIAGSLYVEVDFGESNYLGNLTPQYAFAKGPTAKVIIPTPLGPNTANGYTAISPNNHTAKLVFDGSHCTDPYYLPMQYSWVGYAGYYSLDPSVIIFTATNVMATNVFSLGYYNISLQARDVVAAGDPFYINLQVITAGKAVDLFIPLLQAESLSDNTKQVMTKVLSNAASLFNHGLMEPGCAELEFYEQMVKAAQLNSRETTYLLRPMQDVIDAVTRPYFTTVQR
jgi:hypothetical protein